MKPAPLAPRSLRASGLPGFTLLELLAVITIIAILAGIVIGVGRRASEVGRAARAKAELAAIGSALETYQRTYGDYPRTDEEGQLLRALLGQRGPAADTALAGRALLEAARFNIRGGVLLDPWDRPYSYAYKSQAPWTNSSYVLYSVGPDGLDSPTLRPGGFPDVAPPVNLDNLHANR